MWTPPQYLVRQATVSAIRGHGVMSSQYNAHMVAVSTPITPLSRWRTLGRSFLRENGLSEDEIETLGIQVDDIFETSVVDFYVNQLRITELCDELGVSEVARRMNVHPQRLRELRKGKRQPSLDTLCRFAAGYDVRFERGALVALRTYRLAFISVSERIGRDDKKIRLSEVYCLYLVTRNKPWLQGDHAKGVKQIVPQLSALFTDGHKITTLKSIRATIKHRTSVWAALEAVCSYDWC